MDLQNAIHQIINEAERSIENLVKTYVGLRLAKAPAASKPAARAEAPAKGRVRRDDSQLQAVKDKILDFLSDNPSSSVESVATGLGTSTKTLAHPIKQLLADGHIQKKGQKRATRYFVA